MAASIRSMSLTVTRGIWIAHSRVGSARGFGTCLRAGESALEVKDEITESTAEYTFVERLIPPIRVPAPPHYDDSAPSGWTPPSVVPPSLPYMIRRSRMHNVPVYSDTKHGNQKSTLLRKVEGDIWALNKDVRTYLQKLTGKEPPTQVNEVTGTIHIKGQFDKELKEWLVKQGF